MEIVTEDRAERTFPAPPGYVKWEMKIIYFKKLSGYKPPNTWEDGEPSPLTWELLKRYPVAVPCIGDESPLNPRGSGYYGVVRLDLAEHSNLRTKMGIQTVVPCKEQLLNRYDYEYVEAWPTDTLAIVPAPDTGGSMPSIPEGVDRRNGVWVLVEDELANYADMEAEEFTNSELESSSSSSVIVSAVSRQR